MVKLWGGRFRKKTDPRFEAFSSSFRWDVRLLPYDLAIDRAHVEALTRCGVLKAPEAARLGRAIGALERKNRSGTLRLDPSSEDVHSAVQTALSRLAGPVAAKIHTARSRNDLVAQSSRLYCKDHAGRLEALLRRLQSAFVRRADQNLGKFTAGRTHLEYAQPILLSHQLLAYVEMLERSKAKLAHARALSDVCVLGSGALAGVTFALDQPRMARRLGLSAVVQNSYDAVGDRDFLLDLLEAIGSLGLTLSRIAEDLMVDKLSSRPVFEIDERFCTGSSMMPQKKNADFVELVRGFAGLVQANAEGLRLTLKGLPSSYNRDLQWDKRYLFESVESAEEVLEIFVSFVDALRCPEGRQTEILGDLTKHDWIFATDLADYLVSKGISFAQAHGQAGRIVRLAEAKGRPIAKLGLNLLRGLAPAIGPDVYRLFDPERSVQAKKTVGSTHPARVKQQIRKWKNRLS